MARNMAHNMMQSNGMARNMANNNMMQNQQFQNQNRFQQQYQPNNFHHQGRNDMNYNMMNGQNFQGQKYRENMQSNNMPYDQVMTTVSMMKFMREFMENKYNRMDNIAPRNYDNNQDYSQEFFRRMGNQGMRFKRQVNGNTKPHGSDATNLPGFLELGDRLAEKLK